MSPSRWIIVLLFQCPLIFFTSTRLHAQEPFNIIVHGGGIQTFKGFGVSPGSNGNDNYNNVISDTARPIMVDMVYQDLELDILRLWQSSSDSLTLQDMKDSFYYRYVDSNLIQDAMAHGVDTLLLAPGAPAPADSVAYANKLADFIRDVYNEHGIEIDVTGICNELNTQGWSNEHVVDVVKSLRVRLDSNGFSHVGIISPEAASADWHARQYINAMKDDPVCWDNLLGISTHSYNMAADDATANLIIGTDKEYWMTEAGNTGLEEPGNDAYAATMCARIFNDMNHRVTHWIWFIGLLGAGGSVDNDAATKLIIYYKTPDEIRIHTKYYYLKHITEVFEDGGVFRQSTTPSGWTMTYGYGQKPAINTATCLNPDGSWSIGVINDTGIPSTWSGAVWHPDTTYQINLHVEELANVPQMSFEMVSSTLDATSQSLGSIDMTYGDISFIIEPRQLITLRSESTTLIPPDNVSISALKANQVELSWNDLSQIEDEYTVQRKVNNGSDDWQTIATLPANSEHYTDTDSLHGMLTYAYKIGVTKY